MSQQKDCNFIKISFKFDNKNRWRSIEDGTGTEWEYKSYTLTTQTDNIKVIIVSLILINPNCVSPLKCYYVQGENYVKFKKASAKKFQGEKVTLHYRNELKQNPLRHSVYHDLMLQARNGTQVTLVAKDGSTFNVSKKILKSRSEVFAAMLRTNMIERATRIVRTDIESKLLKALVHFLYTDEIPDQELKFDLAILGDRYHIPLLVKLCESALILRLNEENLEEYSRIATKFHCLELNEQISYFIEVNSS